MTYREPPQHTAETQERAREGGAHSERYLAIFEPGSSRVVPLPAGGELVIGRSAEVSLRLHDPSVSRRHAKLLIADGAVFVLDLESQNGTFVDGEPVVGSRPLASGEVIEISESAIVFHDKTARAITPRGVPMGAFRARAREELARAEVTGRSLTVLLLHVEHERPVEELLAQVSRVLEPLELAAAEGPHRIAVLLPELSQEEAMARAHTLGAVVTAAGARCKVGFARAPADGCDADTLIGSARAAASIATVGTVLLAREAMRIVPLGEVSAVVADAAMLRVYALAERLAQSDLPVLVHGETGTGKELLAAAIHYFSAARRGKRLVSLNCAALSETLVESELFGHERGAFTGATTSKVGLLEAASGGTVFLDEVAELTASTQAKLLRALDAKRILRLGDTVERAIDVRIVAATHRDLAAEVAQSRFRSDLYFRLSGATLVLPPLRDRPRELALLARRFLEAACQRAGRRPMSMSDDAIRALAAYPWPGNVRELRHVLDYVVAAYDDTLLEPWHLEERLGKPSEPVQAVAPAPVPMLAGFRPIEDEVRELESARMRAALAATGGNQRKAAQLIEMPLRTFVTKLARYGIKV